MTETKPQRQYPLSWSEVSARAALIAEQIKKNPPPGFGDGLGIYGVPRGGIPAAMAVAAELTCLGIAAHLEVLPGSADLFVDDIIDSGKTRDEYADKYPGKPFYALVGKLETTSPTNRLRPDPDHWYSFPWERMSQDDGPQDNVRRILQYIGEDVTREGLIETPDRVVRSYAEIFAGYKQKPEEVFKVFDGTGCDEMVIAKNIEFYSVCEHHMQPFFGRACIGYVPNGKVIGVSKLARLLDVYARRLQIQERLTTQVTSALDQFLLPKGSACTIEAKHFCMICRGVNKQHSSMVTSSLTGVFRDAAVRQEFFALAGR